jgi:hypothetical protein
VAYSGARSHIRRYIILVLLNREKCDGFHLDCAMLPKAFC